MREPALAVKGVVGLAGLRQAPFLAEGAILTSHGETIAGLIRLLKDGFAAAERPPAGRSLTNLISPARCSLQEI
ncbi:hypothetical protein CSW59_14530 [Caulobacter sp. BP25]|nr:hypothetical protein CSW59_14530 [Caulobacter sp. BP25]